MPESHAPQRLSVEHIHPQERGGETRLENLAFACQGCNNHKYTHTEAADPISGDVVPLFHPRLQQWRDHFAWSEDQFRIIGLTPTGRATVACLHLNREGLVNMRLALSLMGQHPPLEEP